MQKQIVTLIGAGLALAIQNAPAQNPNASQVVENNDQRRQFESSLSGTNAPDLYPGESSDLGPQSILSVRPSRRWHLEALADEQMYVTDNMFLDHTLREHADVNVSTLQVAIDAPQMKVLGGDLTARVGAQVQWYTYGLFENAHIQAIDLGMGAASTPYTTTLDTFDFCAQTFFIDTTWVRDNWLVIAGFNIQRLTDTGEYNEFYREYTPNLTVEKTFGLLPNLSASLGYQTDYRFSISKNFAPEIGSDMNSRSDQVVYGLLNFKLCDYAILQPYYRFQWAYYTAVGRDDCLNSCGANLLMPISKNVGLRVYYSYSWMETDRRLAQSYREMEGGLGASVAIQF